jgi:hypothetical protein
MPKSKGEGDFRGYIILVMIFACIGGVLLLWAAVYFLCCGRPWNYNRSRILAGIKDEEDIGKDNGHTNMPAHPYHDYQEKRKQHPHQLSAEEYLENLN